MRKRDAYYYSKLLMNLYQSTKHTTYQLNCPQWQSCSKIFGKKWHYKVQMIKHHLVVETCSDPWFLLQILSIFNPCAFFQKQQQLQLQPAPSLLSPALLGITWWRFDGRLRTHVLGFFIWKEQVKNYIYIYITHLLRNLNNNKNESDPPKTNMKSNKYKL